MWSMTPLEQFAHALEETAFPAADMIDSGFPPRDVLAPLGALFEPRDLLTATAVLEAAAPLLAETLLLVPQQGRMV